MTDQQQIENWREEFNSLFLKRYPKYDLGFYSGMAYYTPFVDGFWQGFLMAKRAQKPVELHAAKAASAKT